MTVVSNGQFWAYTLAILIVWIIVLTTAFNNDSNMKNKVSTPNNNNEDELKHTGNCKSLCKHCGCLGFYCGEECICECNNDHSDTECISLMQTNARTLNIPFEILIQGPTANTFVRNAFQFEQNNERRFYGYRNKRSTVTVYKPNKDNHEVSTVLNEHKIKTSCERKTLVKDIFNLNKRIKERHKRSTEQFNWFNDLGRNLLRPAPLGGYKRKPEVTNIEKSATKSSTVSSIFDNSWFAHNTANILTPAPLTKRKKTQTSDIYHGNNVDSSFEKREMDTIHSDEVKTGQFDDKETYLPEENNPDETMHTLTSKLFSRLFKDDKDSDLPEEEKPEEESMETLTSGLYSRLFKDNLSKKNYKNSFLSEENSHESLSGGLYSSLFKDDLSKTYDTNPFLSEEKKLAESQETLTSGLRSRMAKDELRKRDEKPLLKEDEEKKQDKSQDSLTGSLYARLFKDDLSTSQITLPTKVKKGLQEFRIPWFKPVNFFEKVKRVIRP